jgi:hypothetical protein
MLKRRRLNVLRSDLTLDEQRRVRFVLDWTWRMARKYGGIVYEKNGHCWDWGQALARECYGENWNDIVSDTPSWNDISRAKKWEEGEIPDWVDTILTQKKGA